MLDQLKRRFSPSLVRLGAEGARPLPGGGTSGVLALVGRELCLYLHVDATRLPPRQRAGFVALAVRRAAPFADPEHDILWLNGHAAVWYWSRERVQALASGLGSSLRLRAEALFRGDVHAGDAEQLLLLEVVDQGELVQAGVEARVWRQGHLHATRWWPAPPDAAGWHTFARGVGLDGSRPPPPLETSRLHPRPLDAGNQLTPMAGQLGRRLPMLGAGLALLVLALLVAQVAGIARAAWEVRAVEQRIDLLNARLEKVITARETADAAQERIETLLALRAPLSQTRLLGEIKRLTPGSWEMVAWTQPSPAVLEVTIKGEGLDAAAIVSAWEQSPYLQEVAPAPTSGEGQLTLQARLTPLGEQAP